MQRAPLIKEAEKLIEGWNRRAEGCQSGAATLRDKAYCIDIEWEAAQPSVSKLISLAEEHHISFDRSPMSEDSALRSLCGHFKEHTRWMRRTAEGKIAEAERLLQWCQIVESLLVDSAYRDRRLEGLVGCEANLVQRSNEKLLTNLHQALLECDLMSQRLKVIRAAIPKE